MISKVENVCILRKYFIYALDKFVYGMVIEFRLYYDNILNPRRSLSVLSPFKELRLVRCLKTLRKPFKLFVLS